MKKSETLFLKRATVSKSLPSLFKKERLDEEQWEQIALGHKKGKAVKNCQKHTKSMNLSEQIARF